MKRTALRVAS